MIQKERLNDISEVMNRIQKKGGVKASGISKEIGDHFSSGSGINCYPGLPGERCHHLALFVALKGSPLAKGRGHISCRQAFEKVVQHVYGHCTDLEEMELIMITSDWNSKAFAEWKSVLDELKSISGINLQFYLWSGKNLSLIN